MFRIKSHFRETVSKVIQFAEYHLRIFVAKFYPFVDEKSQGEGDSTSDTAVAEDELIDRFQFVKSVAVGKGRLKQNT